MATTESGFRTPGTSTNPTTRHVRIPTDTSEAKLDFWANLYGVFAWGFLVVGVVGGFVVAGSTDEGAPFFIGILVGVTGAASSFFFRALLRGAADVVRLLKKQNGMPYAGDF